MSRREQASENQIEDLILLAQGKLDTTKRGAVERAIANDSRLFALYEVIKPLVGAKDPLSSAAITTAAKRLGERMFNDFQRHKDDPDSRRGVVVYDSQGLPLPEGVRPAAVDTRRLKYRLPDGLVELSVYPISLESYELVGIISEVDAHAPYTVVLKTSIREQRFTTDEVSLFRIPRISRGKHDLRFYSGEELIGAITIDL